MLCACNSNYIEIISDTETVEDLSSDSKISKTQINIDELLIKKELIKTINISNIKKIAILLPMTGKYSKIGKSIFEGIEMELNNNLKTDAPNLVIYDTGDKQINLQEIYSEMLSKDFEYVIGPLRKNLIDKIINLNSNYSPLLIIMPIFIFVAGLSYVPLAHPGTYFLYLLTSILLINKIRHDRTYK